MKNLVKKIKMLICLALAINLKVKASTKKEVVQLFEYNEAQIELNLSIIDTTCVNAHNNLPDSELTKRRCKDVKAFLFGVFTGPIAPTVNLFDKNKSKRETAFASSGCILGTGTFIALFYLWASNLTFGSSSGLI